MSIETNKNDFEIALEKLDEYMAAMDDFAHPDLVEVASKVSEEYLNHYRDDIESLMNEASELKNEIESLKQDLEDYENELGSN